MGYELFRSETSFYAGGRGVAGDHGAFAGGEGGRDGDVEKPVPSLGVQAVGYGFCAVDGTPPADADDGVNIAGLLNVGGGGVQVGDGSVLADFGKGACVLASEQGFDVPDQGCFGGEGGSGDDECFAVFGG